MCGVISLISAGKIDMIVIGAGTGGTVSGLGRKLKEKIPGIVVCLGVTLFGELVHVTEIL